MALVLLLLGLVRVSGSARRCIVVMSAVSVSVAKETTLIVTSSSNVVSVGTWGSVGARRQVGRRIPLGAACGLLNVAISH